MSDQTGPTVETPPQAPADQEQMSQATIRFLSGKMAQVVFPVSMTDDELCQLVMEMTKNLTVRGRVELANRAKPQLVVPPPGFRVPRSQA